MSNCMLDAAFFATRRNFSAFQIAIFVVVWSIGRDIAREVYYFFPLFQNNNTCIISYTIICIHKREKIALT